MDEHHLSQRLKVVASFVRPGARIADIGADHAYLAAALVLNGQSDFAIAGEVAKGPFENAVEEVKRQGLEKKISLRLADGLAAIHGDDQIDTIIIAGMGGALIRRILDEGQAKLGSVKRLILQPNIGAPNLRRWLANHRFQINHEQMVAEDGHIYEIIVADPVGMSVRYNDRELMFGPLLLEHGGAIFQQKWQAELKRDQHTVEQLRQAKHVPVEKKHDFQQKIDLIREVLK